MWLLSYASSLRFQHQGGYVLGPLLERLALLLLVGVLLIDADDAGTRACGVPEQRLDDLESDAEPLHPGGDGSSQVMDAPSVQIDLVGIIAALPGFLLGALKHELVDALLGTRPA